jgi:hypothetical protein
MLHRCRDRPPTASRQRAALAASKLGVTRDNARYGPIDVTNIEESFDAAHASTVHNLGGISLNCHQLPKKRLVCRVRHYACRRDPHAGRAHRQRQGGGRADHNRTTRGAGARLKASMYRGQLGRPRVRLCTCGGAQRDRCHGKCRGEFRMSTGTSPATRRGTVVRRTCRNGSAASPPCMARGLRLETLLIRQEHAPQPGDHDRNPR